MIGEMSARGDSLGGPFEIMFVTLCDAFWSTDYGKETRFELANRFCCSIFFSTVPKRSGDVFIGLP
jgi:hypothetical protein